MNLPAANLPTPAEIRAAQEASVADVERQLAVRPRLAAVEVMGRVISREAAWAACAAHRKAWELGGRYDGQERLEDGTWLARVQIPLGRFQG